MTILLNFFSRKYRLWYPADEYPKVSGLDRAINALLPISAIILFNSALLHLLIHPQSVARAVFVEKVVNIVVFNVAIFFILMSSRHFRSEFSQVIRFVNEQSLQVLRRPDYLVHRPMRNRIYLGSVLIISLSSFVGLLSPIAFLLDSILHGQLYFKNILPLDDTPYSPQMYFQSVLYVGVYYWVYGFSSLFIVFIVEPFLRFSMGYLMIATDIKALRSHSEFVESEEVKKVKDLMRQCSEINGQVN